jgi:type III pantothenate kinase
MHLLLDIGNTNTHLGLASRVRIERQANIPTASWSNGKGLKLLQKFVEKISIDAVAICSVVPVATPLARQLITELWTLPVVELTAKTVLGVGINYPKPNTIGPDRLANAIAARHFFGCPSVVVDFGTAVTFDVVDAKGDYIGGIIAPGLAAMTDYLHEKTALLPKIRIREVKGIIGKNTEEAMLIGAVHGYRGLISELIRGLKGQLKTEKLPVIATGGCALLIAKKIPEVTAVRPLLTLEGLRLFLGIANANR